MKMGLLKTIGGILIALIVAAGISALTLFSKYADLNSTAIFDRNGQILSLSSNAKDFYALPTKTEPSELRDLLITKEDRFFYLHPGVNPFSIARALFAYFDSGSFGASSTITQQLVKILLGNELDRNIGNKIIELWFSFSLELFTTKNQILTMYENVVYLGNNIQGLPLGSIYYFNKPYTDLSRSESISLLATISNPSNTNPLTPANKDSLLQLADTLDVDVVATTHTDNPAHIRAAFDVMDLIPCTGCTTTIDIELNEQIRSVVQNKVRSMEHNAATHAAVVVVSVPDNEILAIVGTPYPNRITDEYQLNMSTAPRPIGSTIKPFIYGLGFENGLRPYSLVSDQEYKYPIATGFSLYPKNFDGQYRGIVSLHEALSNSLNVPTVKVLEYITLETMYDFLTERLGFQPIAPLDSYAYGIALGGLEMDLLTLTHFFTALANNGELRPLMITHDETVTTPQSDLRMRNILKPETVELLTTILSDRSRSVDQFGMASNLNTQFDHAALKTGTSRDFHDNWVMSYTPNFVVGVWVGNAENKPMNGLTGQTGAGRIWQSVMDIMLNSNYHDPDSHFTYSHRKEYDIDGSIEYGLPGDTVGRTQELLLSDNLILSPHNNDSLLYGDDVFLRATESVDWYVNDRYIDTGETITWTPEFAGTYSISAHTSASVEEVAVSIVLDESRIPN